MIHSFDWDVLEALSMHSMLTPREISDSLETKNPLVHAKIQLILHVRERWDHERAQKITESLGPLCTEGFVRKCGERYESTRKGRCRLADERKKHQPA
ncbi:MAG: hypothetical protein US94_C0009G0008 [Berkelbacteria bacterium GW2011_GWB1_38_5]|uniref:Transcriptional regulator n=2 Tax=Candidatus Berkelbacteria TaxID=1618330 RepID=A0A0G0NYF5_9BACT|nr:MAG: hypothetical protein US94_C0009G0008 [Berkelbacteria bacterium GW2011_GWB1_38_5]KKQ90884.1 MAG: hypothetical protein UT15_C0003G0059 [Berkelbacteria bacterium GW2011_GWA1_39_10]